MGNICPCPWLKDRKQKQFAYDVHEETFQMEDNAHNIGEHSPKNQQHDDHENNVLTDDLRSSEDNIGKSVVLSSEKDQQEKVTPSFITIENDKKNQDQRDSLRKIQIEQKTEQIFPEKIKAQQIPQVIPQQKPKFHANILKPKAARKKVNPDDYRFINESQTFKVKKIDSIKQQQFNIDNCKDCFFFIFDITANIYIDDSQNCFIFIAPCQSTVFVRNCKNMVIVAATKQFRTYQCHSSTFSLYCKSQPVIQSSSQLIFTSFSCPIYDQLQKQLTRKRLEPWNNHWSQIHNFTKKQGQIHYKLEERVQLSTINWAKAFEQAQIKPSQLQNPIPLIMGALPYVIQKELLILINKGVEDSVIRSALQGTILLKAFQGVISGEEKEERKIILIDAKDNIIQKYQQIGIVYQDPQQIEVNKAKWFISFGDERQK